MFTGYEIRPLIQKYSNVKGFRDNSPANPKLVYMISAEKSWLIHDYDCE